MPGEATRSGPRADQPVTGGDQQAADADPESPRKVAAVAGRGAPNHSAVVRMGPTPVDDTVVGQLVEQ